MKKWKLAGLILSQLALTYAVFIICIHQPKSKYREIEESVGWQENELRTAESRLYMIMNKYVQHPTTVRIERTYAPANSDTTTTGLAMLTTADADFLMRVVKGK